MEENIETKKCRKCNLLKPLKDFDLRTDSNTYRGDCKDCRKAWYQELYLNNKTEILARQKTQRDLNPEIYRERNKKQREKNTEKDRKRLQKYYHSNKEEIKIRLEIYRATEPYKNWLRNYEKQLMKNPILKLIKNVRRRIISGLKSQLSKKATPTLGLVGCSFENLKTYLENQFEPWMTWENYGVYNKNKKTWQIDHFAPCDAFNLSKPEHQRACFHFSNLRALGAKENRDKWYHLPKNFDLEEFVLFSPGNHSPQIYMAEMW